MTLRKRTLFSIGVAVALALAAGVVLLFPRQQPGNVANRMTIAGGCNSTLRGFPLAATNPESVGKLLTPPNPVKGLICRYFDVSDVFVSEQSPLYRGGDLRLYRSVPIDAGQASLLATELDKARSATLEEDESQNGCGGSGQSYDLYIFGYRNRSDVDVLYNPYGGLGSCDELTNGYLSLTGPYLMSYFYPGHLVAGPVPFATCGAGWISNHKPAPCPSGSTFPFPVERVRVPNVVGMSYSVGALKLYLLGLSNRTSPLIPARNEIVAQSPTPGSMVYAGSEVRLSLAVMR
jgi:PASTA domain-containing protein